MKSCALKTLLKFEPVGSFHKIEIITYKKYIFVYFMVFLCKYIFNCQLFDIIIQETLYL